MKEVFWFSLFMVGFVYVGYPLSLVVLRVFHSRPIKYGIDHLPSVSLIIAAFNEEKFIGEKLENSLTLDYPKDLLQIVVASDGSTDGTETIAKSFDTQGVTLMRVGPRGGKTRALNQVIPQTQGEILILSDANVMYKPQAVRMLVRHFADSSVGAVSGDVRLVDAADSFAESEGIYYQYERWLQGLESQVNSIIGADGGMYALRRKAFEPPPDFIVVDDFVISMSVAIQGYRVVYDAEAIGVEGGTASSEEEFRRKIRVVAGGIQALKFGAGIPKLSQPFLTYCYLFHKLFRWLIPVFLILILISSWILMTDHFIYQITFVSQIACYAIAIGYATDLLNFTKMRWVSIPFYFCLVNGAALIGLVKGFTGGQSVTWKRTTR